MTRLLRWVIENALEDREAFLASIRCTKDNALIAATSEDIAWLRTMLKKRSRIRVTDADSDRWFRAFVDAESTRQAFVDGVGPISAASSPDEVALIQSDIKMLHRARAYRLERWGETQLETALKRAEPCPIALLHTCMAGK